MSAQLSLDRVTAKRGELTVVHDVSLRCPPGEVTVLLGANGAGKSTLLDAVAGVIPVTGGTVTVGSTEIQKLARNRRAACGLSYVEQGHTVFAGLTVEENLAVVSKKSDDIRRAFDLFPELVARKRVTAQMLSGGEQQMLVLGRAIASHPQVLMIDEMSQGLAPVIVKRLIPFVKTAAEAGIAVLLVEQFAALALGIGSHAYVMSIGRIALEGSCGDLLCRPEDLRNAYLAGGTPSVGVTDPDAASEHQGASDEVREAARG